MAEMSKTPEEIKNFETKKELAYIAFGKVLYEGCHKIAEKALAYIQQLEANDSQVQKALQDNGFGSLEELLQAYSQVKRERDAAVADLNCNWKCAICKRYTEPIDKCPLYGECGYGYRNFEWRGVQEPPKEETDHV